MADVTDKITGLTAVKVSKTRPPRRNASGLTFRRLFTKPGASPYEGVEWEKRTAQITDAAGSVIFEQTDVEVPKDWSMTATNIVASKYLHGKLGTPERETGVRQLVSRVAETIRDWGVAGGYFRSARPASLIRSRIRSIPSSPWPRPRACCSSGDRAQARTFRHCAARPKACPAAASPPARSAS